MRGRWTEVPASIHHRQRPTATGVRHESRAGAAVHFAVTSQWSTAGQLGQSLSARNTGPLHPRPTMCTFGGLGSQDQC